VKKLLFLLPFLAFAANAQTVPTRPYGDNSNAAASTAFVNNAVNGGFGHTFTPLLPVIGGASGGLAQGTRSGISSLYPVLDSAPVNGQCAQFDSLGGLIPVACAGGGGGGGTVSAGNAGDFTWYQSTGSVVVGHASPASTELWVNPNGSDAFTGLNPIFPLQTMQTALTALAATGGTVHVTGGPYTISSALAPSANTLIDCSRGTTITEANGVNNPVLVDFVTDSGNSSGMQHCILDGNVAGQTATVCSGNMISIGTVSNVRLEDNTIKNPMCVGVSITDGVDNHIINNRFVNGTYDNINITPSSPQTQNATHITGNTSINPGAHFLEINGSDYNIVDNNNVQGTIFPAIVASVTSPTAVSWVSGPTFAALHAGEFIVCNGTAGYQELFISKVNSSTSLTIGSTTPGTTGTNQNCIAGPGDIIDLTGSFNLVNNNTLTGAVSGGIVINNLNAVETVQQNTIANNNVSNVGNGCLFLEVVSNGGATLLDNSYVGNHFNNCGQGQTPLSAKAGIIIDDGAPTGALNQWFDGNVVTDTQGNTGFWMGMFGSIVQTEATIGQNINRGMVSQGIFQGVRSSSLSGWGTGAAVNGIITNGSSYKITITAGTSGFSAAPTVTMNKAVSGAQIAPQPACSVTTTNGSSATAGVNTASIDQVIFDLQGTPSPGVGYIYYCKE
jgi:parallel beta-helix repeat protein